MAQNPNGMAPRPALNMGELMKLLPPELQNAPHQQKMEFLRNMAAARQRAQAQRQAAAGVANMTPQQVNRSPQVSSPMQGQPQSSPVPPPAPNNQMNPAILAIMRQAQQNGIPNANGQPPQLNVAQMQQFMARQQQQAQQAQQAQQGPQGQASPQQQQQQQQAQNPQIAPNGVPGTPGRPMTPQTMPRPLQGSPLPGPRPPLPGQPQPIQGGGGPPPQRAPIDQDLIKHIFSNLQLFVQKKNNGELNEKQLAMLNVVLSRSPDLLKNLAQGQNAPPTAPNVHSAQQHAVLRQLQNMSQSATEQQRLSGALTQQRNAGPPAPNMAVDTKTSLEVAYRKLEEMQDAKRVELFAKQPAIRNSYMKYMQTLPEERRSQMFANGPGLKAMYETHTRELNAAAAAAAAASAPAPSNAANVPLPNLQIPPNRQKAPQAQAPVGSALTQQQVLAVQAQAASQLQQVQQVQQRQATNSPSSGQVTPQSRAAMPTRPATPAALPPNAADVYAQKLQTTAAQAQQQLQAQAQAVMGTFQPVTISSLIIPENPPSYDVKPQVFPNKVGPRSTLSTGLAPGTILGTPVLTKRPAAFDDLLTKLGVGKRKRGSSLFDGPSVKEDEPEAPVVVPAEPEPVPVEEPAQKRRILDVAQGIDVGLTVSEAVEDVSWSLPPCHRMLANVPWPVPA